MTPEQHGVNSNNAYSWEEIDRVFRWFKVLAVWHFYKAIYLSFFQTANTDNFPVDCVQFWFFTAQKVFKVKSWNQKWQGLDNNSQNELSYHVPHGAIRGKEIRPRKPTDWVLLQLFDWTLHACPLWQHWETDNCWANKSEQCHENERTKISKNCSSIVRPFDFTYLDTRLLIISLYFGIAQFAKRRSRRAKNSLQINTRGELAAKLPPLSWRSFKVYS